MDGCTNFYQTIPVTNSYTAITSETKTNPHSPESTFFQCKEPGFQFGQKPISKMVIRQLPYDVTPMIPSDNDPESVAQKNNKPLAWVRGMLIHREGDMESSNMTAFGLHKIVKSDKSYISSSKSGLIETQETDGVIALENQVLMNQHNQAPKHIQLKAEWQKEAYDDGGQENLLGGNVCFKVDGDTKQVGIPIIEADSKSLLYYGALLIDDGQAVSFPNKEYPIWKMQLGSNYVNGYLMTEKGKGFYLEWHTDRPHWHQPLTEDAGGYYILGKKIQTEDGSEAYNLTGFKIPLGKAVYSMQGAIHCDAALTGKNWLVGFADSDNFSTALVRNTRNEMVKL
ncbi:hypothetical protein [Endozoicomonas sp. SESOKO1]|uniref:hypothetical protein n=1 Tax=Endozoicomonas sp. SESOKO1 TaxID=2828742 RepID=UPI002148C6C5|nr:hypothetical protein [Endozoicomonas sp. SESOKO1]